MRFELARAEKRLDPHKQHRARLPAHIGPMRVQLVDCNRARQSPTPHRSALQHQRRVEFELERRWWALEAPPCPLRYIVLNPIRKDEEHTRTSVEARLLLEIPEQVEKRSREPRRRADE